MPHTNPQEPPIEPSGTTKGVRKSSKGFDAASIDLPEWLPTEVWAMWVENRIATRKPITKIAAKLQLEGLENLRLIGHDPQKVIENAIAVGWMGLYPGKDGCTLATKATTHDGHGNELPACPVQVIVDLYQEVLPELPPVVLMPQTRTEAIARTWHWVLTSVKTDGTRRAEDASQAEAWFRSYFERARMSDFLMGRGQRSNWQCDLDYLLTDKGMAQVIEKTQERVQESFV